jgi:hypothetical protein
MPAMKNIEAAVGENNTLSLALQLPHFQTNGFLRWNGLDGLHRLKPSNR